MELTQKNIDVLHKERKLLELVNTTLDKINDALDQDQISEAIIELAVTMREEGRQEVLREIKDFRKEIRNNTRLT